MPRTLFYLLVVGNMVFPPTIAWPASGPNAPNLPGASGPLRAPAAGTRAENGPRSMSLSLAEALRLGRTQSPLLRAAEANLRAAAAGIRSAAAQQNPVLRVAHGAGRDTGGLDEDILLAQTIELGQKRSAAVSAAVAERDVTLAEVAQTAEDLSFNIRSAYYEALRADAERQLAADDLLTVQAFAQAAQAQFQAGNVAQEQVVRSNVEVARAQQALDAAEVERANRYAQLRSIVGLPEATALTLTDWLDVIVRTYSLPEVLELGLRNRPDVRAARLRREVLAAALRGVRAQSRPDLVIEARHETVSLATGGSSLVVGVTFPLLDLGRRRADMRSAEARVAEQEASLDETARVARLEIETAFRTLELSGRQVASFEGGRLAQAKQLLSMAQLSYEHGASSYLELLDARQVYRTEQVSFARAGADYHIALASLQRAVGGKLP